MQCRRGVASSCKNGFHDFEKAWNTEVANRLAQKLESLDDNNEEEIVLINRKSTKQLQQHCDHCQEMKRMAALSKEWDAFFKTANEQLRESRNRAVNPHGLVAPPTHANTTGGSVPIGHPTTCNVQQLATINQQQAVNVPWTLAHPAHNNPGDPLHNFKHTKWCTTCGCQKKVHVREESFGLKCQRGHCAKCGWLKNHHSKSNYKMGPFCRNQAKSNSPHNLWES